ncbi:glycosyltransferase involved in cell wall biosynthesis [Pelomonas aquatica]|uniref:Glycosyltransferase involved in cell wall biosynthesis n=1 Tax=Pelomonas aquatica TaxID=431058 RepID=A0ABU1Z537_9BURK|nr:glycosyltransferase [Pelomonas aquatica]MDR7295736.1 glycosyltransferase involved in cell wall biosynthesis [Pelomonas aquatica]
MKISVVIRTYNESNHLGALLQGIQDQQLGEHTVETVIVDSGSTDGTLEVAARFPVNVVGIRKEEFSFGRSLNIGCAAATGDVLVFVSGHCIPVDAHWLAELVKPIADGICASTYGRQIGDETSHFSERQIFGKYFPTQDKLPQDGFYCNNANAAVLKSIWAANRYDEELTGLEDMHLAKRLVSQGLKIGYASKSCVYHLHSETWAQVRRRFEREAIALQYIMPEVQLGLPDVMRYFFSAVFLDLGAALQERQMRAHFTSILRYRYNQFRGAHKGNHFHRRVSREMKEAYFYPR